MYDDMGLEDRRNPPETVNKGISEKMKNHLLKDKFWRSLHCLDLKIATKVYFYKTSDFEVLRAKLKQREHELQRNKTAFDISSSSLTAIHNKTRKWKRMGSCSITCSLYRSNREQQS